jgi:hypothetical protein
MKNRFFFALAVVLITAAGCKKTNDATTISYQLTASSPSSTIARVAGISRLDGGTLSWDSGYASVRRIRFEARKDSVNVKYENDITQTINLFDPLQSIGNISLPQGTYTKVEFRADLLPSSAPSLVLYGQFHNGTVITPVRFEVTNECNIKGEEAQVTMAAASSHASITTIDLNVLTSGISASQLSSAAQTAGTIVISPDSNANLYAILQDHLQHLGHQFR